MRSVRLPDVLVRKAGEAVQLRDDVVKPVLRNLRALAESVEILVQRELLDLRKQLVQALVARKHVVIKRGRGFRGKIQNVRPVAAADRRARAVVEIGVEVRRQQHDAVERDALLRQIPREAGGARRAVRFTEQELRRVPAIEVGDVPLDELAERGDVLIDPPVVLRAVAGADDPAKTRTRHIDEDQVGAVEDAVTVVQHLIGRRPRQSAVGRLDAYRAERAHSQPDGRAARAAVPEERDRTPARIDPIPRVRGIEDACRRLIGAVAQRDRAGSRRIVDGLTVDHQRMVRHGVGSRCRNRGLRGGGRRLRCGDQEPKRQEYGGAQRFGTQTTRPPE